MRQRSLWLTALFTFFFQSLLIAQVEPRLKTTTDLSDVYRRSGGSSAMVAIYDYTPASRGMFEAVGYLTQVTRNSYIDGSGNQAQAPSTDSTIFNLFGNPGLDFGYAFGFRQGAAAGTGYRVEVRLIRWPTTKTALQQSGSDVIGRPMYTDANGAVQEAYWNTNVATTLATPKDSVGNVVNNPVTHVRVSLATSVNGQQAGFKVQDQDYHLAKGLPSVPLGSPSLLAKLGLNTGLLGRLLGASTLTVTNIAPTQGAPGAVVVVTGTNLPVSGTSGHTVTFNYNNGTAQTANATFSGNATSMNLTIPAMGGFVGLASIDFSTGNGANKNASYSNFLVCPASAPVLTSFSPTSGVAGSQVVTITGSFLNGASLSAYGGQVSMGGVAATDVAVSGGGTGTSLTFTVPGSLAAGNYNITVTTPCSNSTVSSTQFSVTAAPPTPATITSFTPTTGCPGDSVVITGTNFTTASAVTFNGTAAASFVVNSATQITAVAPASFTTGKIAVTNTGGTVISSGNFTLSGTCSGGSDPCSSGNCRTIDLPCPWKLFDSPHTLDTSNPRRPAANNTLPSSTFSKATTVYNGQTITYDTWSASNALALGLVGSDTITGNFFYQHDYLAWIFGGRALRNSDSSDWLDLTDASDRTAAALISGYSPYLGNTNNFAVPNALKADGTTEHRAGWANGIPTMTRYMAQKTTSINVFLDQFGKVAWVYRFLDPALPGGSDSEELGTASGTGMSEAAGSLIAAGAATDATNLKDLRVLALSDLAASTTALQKMGPLTWNYVTYPFTTGGTSGRMDVSDSGSFNSIDVRNPMPISRALVNTYRQISRNPSLFGDATTSGCPGHIYVVLFPSGGPADSRVSALDYDSANTYVGYYHGNTGLNSGDPIKTTAPSVAQPTLETFHPGMVAHLAAWGTEAPSTSYWDAPWNTTAGTAAKIQTLVVSLGVPGAFKLGYTNNGRNPHEQLFATAQWSNPYRTDHANTGNHEWAPSNGSTRTADTSVVDPVNPGQVHYYPSSDPQQLEENVSKILNYIVGASAALSAPATPATGVRNAGQAYFGTFATSTAADGSNAVPLWTGTLYAIGLDRPASGNIVFYGKGGVPIANSGTGTSSTADFDRYNLWSSYKIFNKYQNPDALAVDDTVILGGPLIWKNRTIYYETTAGNLSKFNLSDTTHLDKIIEDVNRKDPDTGDPLSTWPTAMSTQSEAAELMRFLMGAHDATLTDTTLAKYSLNRDRADTNAQGTSVGHVNIMGDIVNSAPLAVELSKDMADKLPAVVTGDSFYQALFPATGLSTTYDDPHCRLIIVGTNTGHLHCFVEVTGKLKGTTYFASKATELWSFIPSNLMPMLWDLYKQKDNDSTADGDRYDHHYGIDGDPVMYHVDKPTSASTNIGDTRVSNGEDAVVVFGFRKGARDYYALQISDAAKSINPSAPKLVWHIDPLTGAYGDGTKTSDTVKNMGMSTTLPTIATVLYPDSGKGKRQDVMLLSGGYSNKEMDTKYGRELGKLILALDPLTGLPPTNVTIDQWDFSANADMGSIAAGILPVPVLNIGSGLAHRLYWADFKGGVYAINSKDTTSIGYRKDNPDISTWSHTPRKLWQNAAERFTSMPDGYRLSGDFPVTASVTDSGGVARDVKLLTVLVSVGTGDRNNPVDRAESDGASGTINPPTTNNLYVLADRQDRDGEIDTKELAIVERDAVAGTNWPNTYADAVLTPGDASYFWNDKFGYRIPLKDGSHPDAVGKITRDKVLVSPLIKGGILFYSFFNISGNTGFDCSAYATTRTYRQCDITRPFWFDPQADLTATIRVSDSNDLTRGLDNCSGLAFAFNSLSSQLVDSGDYVMQGGAKADTSVPSSSTGTGQNTPDIQSVKDEAGTPGFRLKAWRIVR